MAGPNHEVGNTNSRYRFPIGDRQFVEQWNFHGPAHHCAVGVGHVASKIHKLGALLGMQVNQVCYSSYPNVVAVNSQKTAASPAIIGYM